MTEEERSAERARRSIEARAWWAAHPDRAAEARERGRLAWRERYPERAAIRDEILATEPPQACECGSTDVTLFVTDYGSGAFVWRCRPCARQRFAAARRERAGG